MPATTDSAAAAHPTGDAASPAAALGCAVTVTVSTPETSHTLSFLLGESQAVPWLESAATGLCAGSSTEVPGHGRVSMERVTVPTDPLGATPTRDALLARAEELRAEGNATFKASTADFKGMKRAILSYQLALDLVRRAGGDPVYEARLRSNIALCCLRTCEWTAGIVQCDAVLALQPDSAKAYYRRALALVELDMFVRALSDLRMAHELCPEDAVIKKELDRVQAESRKVMQKRRQQFAEVYNVMPQSSVFNDIIPA